MYLIQTRYVSNARGVVQRAMENALKEITQWSNHSQWETEEEANEKAINIIEAGIYPASHIRVLKVVATFKASNIEKVGTE